jgi:four helix bundle protein
MNGRLPEEFRDRTKRYAASTIRLFIKLPKSREEVRVLGKQMLRSGTSVAAHVREASRARSEAEFASKLGGALQEADETALWLELLREECGVDPGLTRPLETESSELMAIMTMMIKRTELKLQN